MKWNDLFAATFGVTLGESELPVWESALAARGAKNGEICDAIMEVAQMDPVPRADKERRVAKYDLRDLMLWVSIVRQRKAKHIDPRYQDCGLCGGTGMLYGYRDKERGMVAGCRCVPCLCTAGERLLDNRAGDMKGDIEQAKSKLRGIAKQIVEDRKKGYVYGMKLPRPNGLPESHPLWNC